MILQHDIEPYWNIKSKYAHHLAMKHAWPFAKPVCNMQLFDLNIYKCIFPNTFKHTWEEKDRFIPVFDRTDHLTQRQRMLTIFSKDLLQMRPEDKNR